MYSRTNINHKREYYLPASSTTSRGKTITNARAKKIFILRLRIDRLFKWTVCKSKMIWVNILFLFKCYIWSIVIMERSIYLPGIWSPWMVLLQVALKICDFQFESQGLYIMICTSKYMTLEESRQRVITSSVRSKANDTLKAFFLSKYISLCNSKNLRNYSRRHMILEQYSANFRKKGMFR